MRSHWRTIFIFVVYVWLPYPAKWLGRAIDDKMRKEIVEFLQQKDREGFEAVACPEEGGMWLFRVKEKRGGG